MADLVQQSKWWLLRIPLLCGPGIFGITTGNHWVVLLCVSGVATLALVPHRNPLLYWPVGLLGVLVASYVGYWVHWFAGSGGVSTATSQWLFAVVLSFFTIVAAMRGLLGKRALNPYPIGTAISGMMMAVLPVVLIVIVTLRWGNDPARLIAGFVAGGDHNAHNKITHDLLAWSSTAAISSPFQIYSYPNGIHFLIANLIGISSTGSNVSTLVQELRMGAWFETVQLAAYLQLAVVIFMQGARKGFSTRLLLLPPLFFAFASMDSFVGHLFWSGFTTSLGMTWILLVPFVVGDRMVLTHTRSIASWSWVGWCILLAYASWIVYQPYAILFLAPATFVVFWMFMRKTKVASTAVNRWGYQSLTVVGISAAVFIAAMTPYLLQGISSPAVSSLLLDGASSRPYFYTVALWAVVALWGLMMRSSRNTNALSSAALRLSHLSGLIVLTASMILIVTRESDYGILTQPYYTQKMLWIVLFVSVPVALSAVFSQVELYFQQRTRRERTGYLAVAMCCLLLVPLVMGRAPRAALTHGSIDWFAQGLMANVQAPGDRTMAFSLGDVLGSHVSNLALRSFSGVTVPVEIGLSANTFLACRFINREDIQLLYTTGNGVAEMFGSGCDTELKYVVDGKLIPESTSQFFAFPVNTDIDLTTIPAALQHMQRGVLPHSKAGNLATGYNSRIVFSLPQKLKKSILEFDFMATKEGPLDKKVTITVNGKSETSVVMSPKKLTSVDLLLNSGSAGDLMDVTIDCAWSDEETKLIAPFQNPPPCLKLIRMKLVGN